MSLDIAKRYTNLRLWIKVVLQEKNDCKLPLRDKIRAIRHNFPSDLYKMYNLNKNNINDYIPEYERYLSREIDGEYKVILDNKILFTEYFKKFINVPNILFMILDDFYDSEGIKIGEKDITDLLDKNKVIIKPISGTGGGQGVHLLECVNKEEYSIDNNKMSKKNMIEYIKKLKNYIATEFVYQNDYSNKIFKKSTNTIRVITIKDPSTNNFIIPCAVHRFGCEKSGPVDNASKGGFITEIDIESGVLGYTKTFKDLTPLEKHPDTKETIIGTRIPHWNEIKEKLLQVASNMPYIPFIAWDIVVTDKDFSVIEANASSGLNIFQIFRPIKNTKLGEFYKHYGIIK